MVSGPGEILSAFHLVSHSATWWPLRGKWTHLSRIRSDVTPWRCINTKTWLTTFLWCFDVKGECRLDCCFPSRARIDAVIVIQQVFILCHKGILSNHWCIYLHIFFTSYITSYLCQASFEHNGAGWCLQQAVDAPLKVRQRLRGNCSRWHGKHWRDHGGKTFNGQNKKEHAANTWQN